MLNDTNAVNPRACAAGTRRIHTASAPAMAGRSGRFHRVKTNSGTTGQQQLRKQLLVVIGVLLCLCARTTSADQSARAQMKGLDEQVQEVKSDVLSIASELNQLEEKLIYPSDSHVAVFVSLRQGDTLRLDAVHVAIDGRLATDYIYSFKELAALSRGGVQRIYSGNIATGAHEIEVSMSGKLANGKDYTETAHFPFRKEIKPKLIGVMLAGPDAPQPGIHLGDW
jgi:hypothetical protein